ncbi:UNVERIFIED_CONTAM: hypothetical protein Slati_0516200 [Sesamum latifolium]|uniref:SWIM-type domain-containing protein n=1 Tax=Sesamum latifolium TaxID=2727402 RepID=A0AAW2XY30_9LAMI
MQENRDKASKKWKGKICPKIQIILEKQTAKVSDCMPIKADDTSYQISYFDGSQHCVDLSARSCSCRKWQLSGIPCKHACSAIYNQKLDPVDFVHACYSVDAYKVVYAPAIKPMSHEGMWSESCIILSLPPNFGRRAGKPTKARRREADEPTIKHKKKGKRTISGKLRRHQKTVSCRTCGEPGAQHPNILPPAQVENEEDFTPEGGITQEQIPPPAMAPQIYKTGPSIFQQLAMSNAHLALQPRVQIRAPPPMIGNQGLPLFSSTTRVQTTVVNSIIREGGQKYLDLSQHNQMNN